MLSRRDLLKALAAASVGGVLPRPSGARTSGHHPDNRPRYYVFVFLSGGADAVYTADPRTRADVAAGIDVPYAADAIKSFGDTHVGPHLALLGEHVERLAIIKGVHTHVLNHISGTRQFLRLRIGGGNAPSICSVLASQRDSQACAELYINFTAFDSFVPGFLGSTAADGTSFFQLLEETSPEDLQLLARVYRRHEQRLQRGKVRDQLGTAMNLEDCARLFERAAVVPRMKALDWGKSDAALPLQRALWAIENDLACSVFVSHGGWDTHSANHADQTARAESIYPQLATFLSELRSRRNRFGTLWDNTVIFIGSELGRFPRLNQMQGKDHFPQTHFLVTGKGIAPGVYGATGKELDALPISLETGRAKRGGELVTLDDVSATLLSASGLNPMVYGYVGREVRCLTAR